MHFLAPAEWQSWCVRRDIPLREAGWIRPNIGPGHFHVVDVPYERDSGAKVSMARFLFSLVAPDPETLILVDDWEVWPSSQHMPLFARFRQALGEPRPLGESPGHLASAGESDDAVSIIAASLFFIWDCYGISSSGRDAFYISHDEFCFFASRDQSVAEQVRASLNRSGYGGQL